MGAKQSSEDVKPEKPSYTKLRLFEILNINLINFPYVLLEIIKDYSYDCIFEHVKILSHFNNSVVPNSNFKLGYNDITKEITFYDNNSSRTKTIILPKDITGDNIKLDATENDKFILIILSCSILKYIYLYKKCDGTIEFLFEDMIVHMNKQNYIIYDDHFYFIVRQFGHNIIFKSYFNDKCKAIYKSERLLEYYVYNNKLYVYYGSRVEIYEIKEDDEIVLLKKYILLELNRYRHRIVQVFFCVVNNNVMLYSIITGNNLMYEYNVNDNAGVMYHFDVPEKMRIYRISRVIYSNGYFLINDDQKIWFIKKHVI